MNTKVKIVLPSVIGIIIIILAVVKMNAPVKQAGPSGESRRGKTALPVEIRVVTAGKLTNSIVATGTVLANEEVELRSETAGKITGIFFREGTRVKKNDLLVKINDADLQAQLASVEYNKKLAEQKEYRQRMLLEKSLVSREEYEMTQNELNVQLAAIQLKKAQIAKTEIRAPFDGRIGLKYVSEGEYLDPSVRIAHLQNTDALKVDFSVPEKYSSLVKTGETITFTVDGDNNKYHAKVYAAEPKIETGTRTLKMRAITKDYGAGIHPGSFAKVEFFLGEMNNALLIPTEALVQDFTGLSVFLYKNGKAVKTQVETGIRKQNDVQITSGVEAGDSVIVTGIMQLKPGMKVKPVRKSS